MEENVFRLSTFFNVLCFWLSGGVYSIPEKHHFNMLIGRGCSVNMLRKYFYHGHSFNLDAVLHVLQTNQKVALDLLEHNFFCEHLKNHMVYRGQAFEQIAKLKGVRWMITNGFEIDEKMLESILKNANSKDIKLLIENVGCLRNCEKTVFNSKNKQLIISYIKNHRVKTQNLSLLVKLNDRDIYNALIDEHVFIPSEIAISIFSSAPNDVALKIASNRLFDEDEIAYIVDNDRCDLLEACLRNNTNCLPEDSIKYISKNASLKMFEVFAKELYIPEVDNIPVEFYDRLIETQNHDLLKAVIRKSPLPDKVVEKQIEGGNEEIIASLNENDHSFTGRSAVAILKSNNAPQIEALLKQKDGIGYYGECWLFKSGLDNYIKLYLDSEPKLSDFSKAMLFRHAKKQIVLDFIANDSDFTYLQFQAILERKDEYIINVMLDLLQNFHEDSRYLSLFMCYAPASIIENFFSKRSDDEGALEIEDDDNEVSMTIFKDREPIVQDLFIKNFEYYDEDIRIMLQFGDTQVILKHLDCFDFDDEDIRTIIKRKDISLIKEVAQKYEIPDEAIYDVLSLWNEDIVLSYEDTVPCYSDELYEYID